MCGQAAQHTKFPPLPFVTGACVGNTAASAQTALATQPSFTQPRAQAEEELNALYDKRAAAAAQRADPAAAEAARARTAAMIASDLDQARAAVHTAPVKIVAAALLRFRELLRLLVAAPAALPAALHARWSALFASQRYENFLMSEGERVWYWRNRSENERWFWEIFFWDRLLAPILWTVCYQLIVPNNFIWAVIVPLSFHYWQAGDFPSPWSPQFWLIGGFGFLKCADQLAWLLDLLLRWW